MAKTIIETYRGCEIYKLTPPNSEGTTYGSPCVTLLYNTISAVRKRICQGQGWSWVDGKCVEPGEPEPPAPPEPYLEETYRGVEIWWVPSLNMFRAEVAPGYVAVGWTLPVIREGIDAILEYLNPPEEPEEGLLAQITAAVKAWVLEYMPGWVLEWGQNVWNTVTNIVENITNVYNDLREYVTNKYYDMREYVTNRYYDLRKYVTNVYNDTYQYLTQNITNIVQNITNVIGASTEWVDERLADNREWTVNFFKLMDPTGFLKDPLGTVSAAFALWKLAADNVVVESFLAGFEEGLAEET